jgi:hypothetical protein
LVHLIHTFLFPYFKEHLMKKGKTNRPRAYSPRFETLENRWQPGSLLTKGLDLAVLGAALDPNALEAADQAGASSLHDALNFDLGSFGPRHADAGGTIAVAPYQVTHQGTEATSSLTLGSKGSSDLGFLNQGLAAASAHAHPGSHQRGAGAVSASGTGGVQSAGQAQQGTQSGLTATPTPIQPSAAVTPQVVTPVSAQPANVQVVALPGQSNGSHPPITALSASFFAGTDANGNPLPGEATLYHVVQTPDDSTVYAVGWLTDPNTGNLDLTVAEMTSNLQTLIGAVVLPSPNGGNSKGFGIDLDSSGNVLVSGTAIDVNGNQGGLIASIGGDLTNPTLNWAFLFNGPATIMGIKDAPDLSLGANAVYFTGSLTDGAGTKNILIGETDEAGNIQFASVFPFADAFGDPLPSVGNAIGVDPNTGNIDVAGAIGDPTGVNGSDPAFFQAAPAGASLSAQLFADPGAFTGVQVDAAGNAYYAGYIFAPDVTGAAVNSVLVAKVNADGATLSPDYGGNAWLWTFTNGTNAVNSPVYDNKIDPAGDQLMELTTDDGMNSVGSHSQFFFELDSSGGNNGSAAVLDFGTGGVGGSNDDFGYGIATDGAGNIWTVGRTNSPDFTVNGFQTVYNGGPWDGWIASATTP